MRQIILDTETTGLDPTKGDKIIEIGCVEIINRRLTGKVYHQYINPQRAISEGAFAVHGISTEFLQDKPVFADIAAEFVAFIKDAEIIIHNAAFDEGFINYELALLKKNYQQLKKYCTVIDTLLLARKLHPGQKNSLDALCKRYSIDNSQRNLHGALLDAHLLGGVYLAMTGGQSQLFSDSREKVSTTNQTEQRSIIRNADNLVVLKATEEELTAHQQRLQAIAKKSSAGCLWEKLEKDIH